MKAHFREKPSITKQVLMITNILQKRYGELKMQGKMKDP